MMIMDALKRALGIRSPSRVFLDWHSNPVTISNYEECQRIVDWDARCGKPSVVGWVERDGLGMHKGLGVLKTVCMEHLSFCPGGVDVLSLDEILVLLIMDR